MSRKVFCLLLICVLYLSTQAWWYLSTPLGQSPDEVSHVDFINHLLDFGELPQAGESFASAATTNIWWTTARGDSYLSNPNDIRFASGEKSSRGQMTADKRSMILMSESGQAPLAYLLPAVVIAPKKDNLDALTRWHIIRLISIALGFPAIIAGWCVGRKLWPKNSDLGGLVLAGWMLALPMSSALRSVATNDVLALSIGSWLSAFVIIWRKPSTSKLLIVGLLLSAGLLTKASLLAFVPIVLVWVIIISPQIPSSRIENIVLVTTPSLIGMSLYYLLVSRGGLWHYTDSTILWNSLFVTRLPWAETLGRFSINLYDLPDTFWGRFGMARIYRPAEEQLLITALLTLPLIAPLVNKRKDLWPSPDMCQIARMSGLLVVIVMMFIATGVIKELLAISHSCLSGRHLLIIQLPIGIILIFGWTKILYLFTRWQTERASLAVGLVLLAICLLSNWQNVFNVMQVTFFGGRASVTFGIDNLIYRQLCGNLPISLKTPALWHHLYLGHAFIVVATVALSGYLFWEKDSRATRIIAGLIAGLLGWMGLILIGL